ncbi:MAG: hypothetical protein OCD01_11205 [Fibrobacterales bacterium]
MIRLTCFKLLATLAIPLLFLQCNSYMPPKIVEEEYKMDSFKHRTISVVPISSLKMSKKIEGLIEEGPMSEYLDSLIVNELQSLSKNTTIKAMHKIPRDTIFFEFVPMKVGYNHTLKQYNIVSLRKLKSDYITIADTTLDMALAFENLSITLTVSELGTESIRLEGYYLIWDYTNERAVMRGKISTSTGAVNLLGMCPTKGLIWSSLCGVGTRELEALIERAMYLLTFNTSL